jgi:transcriptional regulator with XRE-family HTH domain
MSKLIEYREQLNLTQSELSKKSGVSVRTIQRIESGIDPKGYTLNALAKTLGINESNLVTNSAKVQESNTGLVNLINLSSLIVVFVPIATFILPLIITLIKKQLNSLTQQIILIQVLWSVLMIVVYLAGSIVLVTELSRNIGMLFILLLILVNAFIILRNSIELKKTGRLYFKLKHSII